MVTVARFDFTDTEGICQHLKDLRDTGAFHIWITSGPSPDQPQNWFTYVYSQEFVGVQTSD